MKEAIQLQFLKVDFALEIPHNYYEPISMVDLVVTYNGFISSIKCNQPMLSLKLQKSLIIEEYYSY